MFSAMKKLMRIPWRGYSTQVSLDVILPFLIVPISIYAASFSLYWTLAVFIGMVLLLIYLRKCLPQSRPRSHFFIMWLVSSILWLLVVFNIFVIDFLEILPEENLLLVVLASASVLCLYNAKAKAHQGLPARFCASDVEAVKEQDSQQLIGSNDAITFCSLCQANVPNRDSHCIWLDCCIGSNNHRLFLCGIFLGMSALFYGSNLTLTTVCHPFILYKTILLPDDCSDVYYEFSIAMCFVCGLYSLMIATLMLIFLIRRAVGKARQLTGSRLGQHSSNGCNNALIHFFRFRAI